MKLEKKDIQQFRAKIRRYYRLFGRTFPWRETNDPYHILVSEIMLQQTQTYRVEPKYNAFIKRFPTIDALAEVKINEVYALWQGLGYNRRARFLHAAAKEVVLKHDSVLPQASIELLTLPGIGPYTAGAVAAFAHEERVPIIETNIRAVYLHYFFPGKNEVSDKELLSLIEQTLPNKDIRGWYNALMDYGAYLKVTTTNPSRRSKHHTKQSKFEGSRRQVRGEILRVLLKEKTTTEKELRVKTGYTKERITDALNSLTKDGTLQKKGEVFSLAN